MRFDLESWYELAGIMIKIETSFEARNEIPEQLRPRISELFKCARMLWSVVYDLKKGENQTRVLLELKGGKYASKEYTMFHMEESVLEHLNEIKGYMLKYLSEGSHVTEEKCSHYD